MNNNIVEQEYDHCQGCFQSDLELNGEGMCEDCEEYFSDWTYEKPLREDVPAGYEIVNIQLERKHFQPHKLKCTCEECEYDEQEKTTEDMGLIIQEGEAFGKKIDWFDIRTGQDGYHWDDYEDGIGHPVGIGSNHYLGHGCWTRYETDHSSDSPYGEHVIRQLKKKETVCDLEESEEPEEPEEPEEAKVDLVAENEKLKQTIEHLREQLEAARQYDPAYNSNYWQLL